MPKKDAATEQPSFEQALARLEEIAHALEDGNLGLEESLASYEEGVRHLKTCHKLLDQAQRKIELLSGVDADGNPISEPFDEGSAELDEKAESRSRRRSAPSPAADRGEDRLDEPPGLF